MNETKYTLSNVSLSSEQGMHLNELMFQGYFLSRDHSTKMVKKSNMF